MEKKCFDFVETVSGGDAVIFVGKSCSMIEINDSDYDRVAEILRDAIGEREFFSGSVEYECDRFSSSLTATLLVYRTPGGYAAGNAARQIDDVVPVWWEFSTTVCDGTATLNDFGFGELRDRFRYGF